jgi:putative transposase
LEGVLVGLAGSPLVVWSVLYLLARRVVAFLVLLARGDRVKAIEVLVLRHEISVLRRQMARPVLEPVDRVWLAALSRPLPRRRWGVFFVSPATLLR